MNEDNVSEGLLAKAKAGVDGSGSPDLKKTKGLILVLWYVALVLTFGVMYGTDLISDWGKWYSSDPVFRQQTQALLRGSVALGNSPKAIVVGTAWGPRGVQQTFGLGVPLWRLPFEGIARIFGREGFPDRLALGLFMAAVVFWTLRVLTVSPSCRTKNEWFSSLCQHPEVLTCVMIVVLFPPFLALCREFFASSSESAAYAYFFSICLLVSTLRFLGNPGLPLYCSLATASAAIAFFSPAALAGGVAALLIAFFHTRTLKWPWRKSLMGASFFLLVGIALFGTNYFRFGSGFEFGHSISLEVMNGAMFASRFSNPFASEPPLSAARELFGLLFRVGGALNGDDWYKTAFFPGQSPTFRWRQLNFTTYDLWWLGILIAAWGLALWRWRGSRQGGLTGRRRESVVMALWSFLSFVPLFLFYLRAPFISSVSLLSFAPSIAIAALSCVWAIGPASGISSLMSRVARFLLIVAVTAFWAVEVFDSKVYSRSEDATTSDGAALLMAGRKPGPFEPLPQQYAVGAFQNGNVFFNGLGWNAKTGEAASCAAFLVNDPEYLEIAVAAREDTPVPAEEFNDIQARIGMEKLVRESNVAVAGGQKLIFNFPERSIKPAGIQVVFLGFVSGKELSTANSKFRLLGIKWHGKTPEFNIPALLQAAASEGSIDPYGENRAKMVAEAEEQDHAPYTPPDITNPLPVGILAFDSESKEATVHEGDAQAHFVFNLTNVSSKEVVVTQVTTSCGCTTAELPPMPWTLAARGRARIPVTMNVLGHTGKSSKTVTVTTLLGFKPLKVEANILPPPADNAMGDREQNLQIAKADRQAVLKGACAKCHVEPATGKMGEELYTAACGICHEAAPRATMVTDLHALNHPTDYNFWKTIITSGKPGTLMPAFGAEQGGPLSEKQIASLAEILTEKFPSRASTVPPVKPDSTSR